MDMLFPSKPASAAASCGGYSEIPLN